MCLRISNAGSIQKGNENEKFPPEAMKTPAFTLQHSHCRGMQSGRFHFSTPSLYYNRKKDGNREPIVLERRTMDHFEKFVLIRVRFPSFARTSSLFFISDQCLKKSQFYSHAYVSTRET